MFVRLGQPSFPMNPPSRPPRLPALRTEGLLISALHIQSYLQPLHHMNSLLHGFERANISQLMDTLKRPWVTLPMLSVDCSSNTTPLTGHGDLHIPHPLTNHGSDSMDDANIRPVRKVALQAREALSGQTMSHTPKKRRKQKMQNKDAAKGTEVLVEFESQFGNDAAFTALRNANDLTHMVLRNPIVVMTSIRTFFDRWAIEFNLPLCCIIYWFSFVEVRVRLPTWCYLSSQTWTCILWNGWLSAKPTIRVTVTMACSSGRRPGLITWQEGV